MSPLPSAGPGRGSLSGPRSAFRIVPAPAIRSAPPGTSSGPARSPALRSSPGPASPCTASAAAPPSGGLRPRPSASGDYKYAYLTDDVVKGQTKDADADDALVLHVFGENGAETLYDTEDFDKTAIAALEAGQVIKYTEDGSKIKDVAVAGTAVAITGVEDKNKGYVYYLDSTTDAKEDSSKGKSISKKLDEDVFFVKIDDANTTAVAGTRAEVVNAHSESKDKLSANAYIVVEDEKIVAVFYDIDKLDGAAEFVDKN